MKLIVSALAALVCAFTVSTAYAACDELVGPHVDWSGRDKSDADLFEGDLEFAKLIDANLSNALLTQANLFEANLSAAVLESTNLTNANLTGARLLEADLTRANLSCAKLIETDLTGAILTRATWTDGRICAEDSIGECK